MIKSATAKQKVVHLDCEKYEAESFDYWQAYQRVKDGGQCNQIEESKAVAFFWTGREAAALGKNPRLAVDDPVLAGQMPPVLSAPVLLRLCPLFCTPTVLCQLI